MNPHATPIASPTLGSQPAALFFDAPHRLDGQHQVGNPAPQPTQFV